MIQEILDYLLIRSTLVNSTSQEIIENTDDKAIFSYLVHAISSLMQQEDFLLVDPSFPEKVSDLIQFYRFDYNQEKDLNSEMNYIIGRLSDYKKMSFNRKQKLIQDWINQETKNRDLPKYSGKENLLGLISLDGYYFCQMISIQQTFEIENAVEYLSILNIIHNKFPDFFKQDLSFVELNREICNHIQSSYQLPRFVLKMNRRILKKLNENYAIDSEIQKQIQGKMTYQLIKRK